MRTLNGFLVAFLGILLITLTKNGTTNESGAPAGRAGAPPNEITCAKSFCHNDNNLDSGNGSLKITVLQNGQEVSNYEQGSTYNLKLELSDPNMKSAGFQITAQRTDNDQAVGSFDMTDSTKFAGANNDYLTHSDDFRNFSNQTKTWDLTWQAPDEDAGEIKFYAAANAANGQGNSSGDYIYSAEQGINYGGSSSVKENQPEKSTMIYPNPVRKTINIYFPKSQQEDYRVTLHNLKGQAIDGFSETMVNNQSANISLPQDLEKGVYMLKLKSQENLIQKRILVQ